MVFIFFWCWKLEPSKSVHKEQAHETEAPKRAMQWLFGYCQEMILSKNTNHFV